jgi:hypothetical protein
MPVRHLSNELKREPVGLCCGASSRSIAVSRAGESGIGKFTFIVFGVIVGAAVFAAYSIGPFFYCYFEIENQMASLIRVASTHTDQEIRSKLLYHIKKLEIPVEPDDIIIDRSEGFMSIGFSYSEVFYLTWRDKDYDLHTFHFDAYADGNY